MAPLSRHEHHDLLERTAALGAVVLAGLACVLLAGAPARVQATLWGGSVVVAGIHLAGRLKRKRPVRVPLVALPVLVGAGLTTLELIPLPHVVRAFVSPESANRIDRVLRLLPPATAALVRPVLAFDPPEAALALARLLTAVVVIFVIADRTRSRSGRAWVWRAILVVAFVVGFAHLLALAGDLPRAFDVVGVPVNGNHRARVLGALGLLCLGRSLTLRPRVEASWFGVAGGLCTLLVPVTLSRGGIFSLVVGAMVLAAILVRREEGSRRRMLVAAGVAVTVVAGAALLVVGEKALLDLADETLSQPHRLKTFLWSPSWRLAVAEPFLGVGNNGFGVALPGVLGPGELDATLTYTHAENGLFQTLADHGFVGGGAVLLCGVVVLVVTLRTLARPAELAALPALAFLVAGDIFDFALELPAGLLLAAVCLGLLGGRMAPSRKALLTMPAPAAVAFVAVLAGVGAWAAFAGVSQWRRELDEDLGQLAAAERRPVLERALASHPSDATYATLLAMDARRRREPAEALRFANRAIVLWPAHRPAQLEVARALFATGHQDQAMLHYREAWRASVDRRLIDEIAQRSPDDALRRRALPLPVTAKDLALLCDVRVREKRVDDARACYREVLTLPDASAVHARRTVTLALEAHDVNEAKSALARVVGEARPDGDDASLAARVLAAGDGVEAALAQTASWLDGARMPLPLLEWRLKAQRELGRADDAVITLERMLPLATSLNQRQAFEMQLAELLWKRGDTARALEIVERATQRRPRDAALLAQRASMEMELGREVDARATIDRLRTVAPGDRRIRELDERLQRTMLP